MSEDDILATVEPWDAERIRAQVERVVSSAAFARSPRMRRFLRFIIEESLAGRGDVIKEYVLAVGVFDKPSDFDPASSASIRVEAGRLRRMLDHYNAEIAAPGDLLISVPKGTYCPRFDAKQLEATSMALAPVRAPGPAPSPDFITGERRWLTVVSCLFGDGANRQDYGDEMLAAYAQAHEICRQVTKDHCGKIDASAADRITIYFGWPQPLEDNAGRAMTAALAIVHALRHRLAAFGGMRIGIASSQVLTRACIPRPLILGEAPAMVGKMLGLVPQNGVLVADSTRQLSATPFEFVAAGSLPTGGDAATLLWRLLRAGTATRYHSHQSGDHSSAMIGRIEELALLRSRWRHASNGEGQAVIVEGEAGIGKSRLCETLLSEISQETRAIRLQCSPHHGNIALHPITEFLSDRIASGNPETCPERRLHAFLSRADLASPMNLALLGNLLLQLPLGSAELISASERKSKLLRILLDVLLQESRTRPVALFMEDLHWADPTTLELIEMIVGTMRERRLLVILTGRPSSSPLVRANTAITHLRLARLPKSDCSAMIDHFIQTYSLSESARLQILDKAEGVPLFVEELTKCFLAFDGRHMSAAHIPESLSDLFAVQLGQMGFARAIAQLASVVGRRFSADVLRRLTQFDAAVIAGALDQLVAADILTHSSSGEAGIYAFRHALLRDAAYGSILDSDRKELHCRVAALFAQADNGDVVPEMVARHLQDAGRYREAIPYWREAGRKAASRYDLFEAIVDLRQAFQAHERLPDCDAERGLELELLLELGLVLRNAFGYSEPELLRIYERARVLAAELDRPLAMATAVYGQWTCAAGAALWLKASEVAREFHALARHVDDDGTMEVEAQRLLGASAAFLGEFAVARLHFERAMQVYNVRTHGPNFGFDPGAASSAYLTWTLWHLGDYAGARLAAERALAIVEAKGHPSTSAMVHAWLIFYAICERDLEAVERYNVQLQAICSQRDCRYWQPFGTACSEWTAFQLDRRPARIEKLLSFTGDFREKYFESCLYLLGAEMCGEVGMIERGLELVALAKAFIRHHDEHLWEADCNRVAAILHLDRASPDLRKVGALLREATKIASRQQAVPLQKRIAAARDAWERRAKV